MSRILVAHADPLIRKDCRQIVEAEPEIEEVGEAATGTEALDHLRRSAWQLVLLALSLPDRTGHDISAAHCVRVPRGVRAHDGCVTQGTLCPQFPKDGREGFV
jgi:two-component system, NarL family, invasion response regulator UvrY